MLEQKIDALIAAVDKNTAAVLAATGTPAAAAGTKAPKAPKAEAAPAITVDEVKAKAFAVKEKCGETTAKGLITSVGAKNLAGMDPKKYSEFVALCDKALAGEESPDDEL